MAAAVWCVPQESVRLVRTDGYGVGVILSHPSGLRWEWLASTEKCNVGTLGILHLALDAYRDELNRKMSAIRNALDAYHETV